MGRPKQPIPLRDRLAYTQPLLDRMIQLRRQQKLTQKQVAVQLGVSRPCLSLLETRRVTITDSRLRRLAAIYGAQPAEFLALRGTPEFNLVATLRDELEGAAEDILAGTTPEELRKLREYVVFLRWQREVGLVTPRPQRS